MIRGAALLVAALFCGGCLRGEDEKSAAHYLVYTRGSGPAETVWIGDVDGRRMRRLVRGTAPLVAPDGSAIAFQRCRESWACHEAEGVPDLYTIAPAGGTPRLVARGVFVDGWFPDSRHVLSVERTLVKIDADSGKRTVIARPASQVQGWSISPDGDGVVYAVAPREGRDECETRVDLFAAEVESGDVRRLTTGGRNNDPVWGEDRIAFAREATPTCIGNPASGIWTMRPDGTDVRTVVPVSPRRFSWNGYYGLQPFGWVRGRSLLVVGVRSEWGPELALLDTRSGRIRAVDLDPRARYGAPMPVDYPSRDGRHVLGLGCGAEHPCSVRIYSMSERRARNVITGRVGSPHWNR